MYKRPLHPKNRRPQRKSSSPIIGGLVVVGIAAGFGLWPSGGGGSVLASGDCNIKGNVSIDSGERIFHVPGQKYYLVTKISPAYGERWFCSESEARNAGWRKSKT